jgi:hypothetical protein
VSNGKRADLFWRSSMSGGRATIQLRKGIVNKTQAGDLTAIDPAGYDLLSRCYVEAKFYRNLQIAEGIIKGTGSLFSFWCSTAKRADALGKMPVLIAKQNFFPILALCRPEGCIFETEAMITVAAWGCGIYSFDEATRVRHRLQRPGGGE